MKNKLESVGEQAPDHQGQFSVRVREFGGDFCVDVVAIGVDPGWAAANLADVDVVGEGDQAFEREIVGEEAPLSESVLWLPSCLAGRIEATSKAGF
jgi:hypothetical protein